MPSTSQQNQAFENAYKTFYESLPSKEKMSLTPCASDTDFVKELEKLCNLTRGRRKKSTLARISQFAQQFLPFLAMVDAMEQSSSSHTALLWGTLKLIFTVCLFMLSNCIGRGSDETSSPASSQHSSTNFLSF